MRNNYLNDLIKRLKSTAFILSAFACIALPSTSEAFPVYAQQAYENPREATGRIVCANCHLAQKPVEIEVPQGVLPDSVFEVVVEIPYEKGLQQVVGTGAKGPLQVGSVLILPEGFGLAPKERLTPELIEKTKGVAIAPYSDSKQNILVVGPIQGDTNQTIVFPILAPNPADNKTVHFIKYPIYVGANRGRGQINPTGDKSNNTVYTSPADGQVTTITTTPEGYTLAIRGKGGDTIETKIPKGPSLLVKQGEKVTADQPLTNDPNVGGFGQGETEIVLQSPARVKGMIAFFFTVIFAQIMLVLKKKQFEKVQLAEMNF
jgi:apocytochrome f